VGTCPGVTTTRRFDGRELVPYWIAQFLGAFLAAGSVYAITRQSFALESSASHSVGAVLMVEFLFTFALALMVLQTATAIDTEGNSFYGLAIGFTLAVAVFAGGPISGARYSTCSLVVTRSRTSGSTWSDRWLAERWQHLSFGFKVQATSSHIRW
jgi:aquaporin Z